MKKIILALDFSDLYQEVEQAGLELCSQFKEAEIYLMSVVKNHVEVVPTDTGVLVEPWEAMVLQAKEQLTQIRDRYPALSMHVVTAVGDPKQEILAAADKIGADMIILGTNGHTGWTHAMLGSTAEYIIRHATLPVLVVPLRKQPH